MATRFLLITPKPDENRERAIDTIEDVITKWRTGMQSDHTLATMLYNMLCRTGSLSPDKVAEKCQQPDDMREKIAEWLEEYYPKHKVADDISWAVDPFSIKLRYKEDADQIQALYADFLSPSEVAEKVRAAFNKGWAAREVDVKYFSEQARKEARERIIEWLDSEVERLSEQGKSCALSMNLPNIEAIALKTTAQALREG